MSAALTTTASTRAPTAVPWLAAASPWLRRILLFGCQTTMTASLPWTRAQTHLGRPRWAVSGTCECAKGSIYGVQQYPMEFDMSFGHATNDAEGTSRRPQATAILSSLFRSNSA